MGSGGGVGVQTSGTRVSVVEASSGTRIRDWPVHVARWKRLRERQESVMGSGGEESEVLPGVGRPCRC